MMRKICGWWAVPAWLVVLWLVPGGVAPAQVGDKNNLDARLFKALPPRCIGPSVMSGRVCDVAVVEKKPTVMYVASASGGLWKTVNNGSTWTAVFERETTVALGAVAVSQSNPDIVWVGTGEANARNSVSWGDGVYKSIDAGKSWKQMGLADSHHVGRIVIHPTNPDIVYVAALGHVWGPNKVRGMYKTTDGGKSWQLSKYIDEDTGFVDVAMDPSDPDTLYAAAYQVRRDAFSGGNPAKQTGPGSGLYKTTDGGKTWDKLTTGLPQRPMGRCGLSIYRKDPNIVYAVIQTDKTTSTTAGQAANLKHREITDAMGVTRLVTINADDGGVFRSDDKGKTWKQVNSLCPRPFYYGQIRVDPNNDKRIYVLGIDFHVSNDGGKTFADGTGAPATHVDHHALWINPNESDHMVLGNDGGLYFSYDRGQVWEHLKNLPISQFYGVGVDMRKPYHVYGGLQDNGTWAGPSASRDPDGITIADWQDLLGYDGFYCQIDRDDQDILYCEGQYGMLRRIHLDTGKTKDIRPRLSVRNGNGSVTDGNIRPPPPLKSPALRFNWSSPIVVSKHAAKTLYYAGNHVFRSSNRGDTWEIISPDLTHGKPGPSPYNGHTITALAESPRKQGVVFVGTDDGRVHVSLDDGQGWTDVSDKIPDVPAQRWISRIECSAFAETTAYLSIDRHRNDDQKPYLFKTTDHGATWTSIANNLPAGSIHVIREDPRNKDLLYVGTEFGLLLSLDGGATWHRHSGLPTVAVHDLVVHPRDQELIICTHGRGIWIMDVAPLQEMTAKVLADWYLFSVKAAQAYLPRSKRTWTGTRTFLGTNPPYGTSIYYYLKNPVKAVPIIQIRDGQGKLVAELKGPATGNQAGLHQVVWELRRTGTDPFAFDLVPPGEYMATLTLGGYQMQQRFLVEPDAKMKPAMK
jgi:photosystem II stability/assembly factor-like uncharacterized protein